jgi:hypothetical protein
MNAPERLDPLVTKTCYLDGSDPEKKREEIRRYFHQTFSLYESLSTASPVMTPITRRRRRCDTRSFSIMATPPYFLSTSCMSPS